LPSYLTSVFADHDHFSDAVHSKYWYINHIVTFSVISDHFHIPSSALLSLRLKLNHYINHS